MTWSKRLLRLARDEDRSGRHRLHAALVDRQIAAGARQSRLAKSRPAGGQLLGGRVHVEYVPIDVNEDTVSALHERKRPADGGLGRDLGDGQSLVAQPGELSVAYERD